jgi:hypothetical protein
MLDLANSTTHERLLVGLVLLAQHHVPLAVASPSFRARAKTSTANASITFRMSYAIG